MKFKILLAALFAGASSCLAQNVHEVIERYNKIIALTASDHSSVSCYLQGESCAQKLCFPTKMYVRLPKNLRMEMQFQNLTFYVITNDSLTWEYNPMSEKSTIKKKIKDGPEEESDQSGRMDFANDDLIHYKERKFSARLLGKEELDSLEVFVIEVTKAKKEIVTFYINSKSYLINKIVDKKGTRYFLNYTFQNGFVFPRYIKNQGKTQPLEMRFPLVKFNEQFPETLFLIPDSAMRPPSEDSGLATLLDDADKLADRHPDSAMQIYSRSLKQFGDTERARNSRGLLHIKKGNYYEAIGDFNAAIEINPDNGALYNNRGLAKYYLNDFANAVKDYDRAVQLSPKLPAAYENRGLAYVHLSKFEEAVADFTTVLTARPDDGKNYFNRGVVLAQLEKHREAIEDYKRSEQFGHEDVSLFNYRGVSEYQLEWYDSALVSFQKAVEKNQDDLQFRENLARTLYELERYTDAEEHFAFYMDRSPESTDIINLAGLCQYFQENYKAAIKLFTTAIEKNPKEAVYFDNRAAARAELEDYTGAIADYDQSISIYPSDASIFYKRGLLKIHTSKKIEGCLDLATANEMKYEQAKEAIIKNCN